jgi:hypothetical protein
MIESFIEGRIRLRSPIFEDAELAGRVRDELLKIKGVEKAEINSRTKGFLLEYDKTRLPLTLLKKAAPLLSRLNGLTNLPADERAPALEEIIGAVKKVLGIC